MDLSNRDRVVAVYVLMSLGFLVNGYLYYTLPDCSSCTLTTKDGVDLTGNCSYLKQVRDGLVSEYLDTYSLDMLPEGKEIQFDFIEYKNQTTTTTTTQPTTTSTTCPSCPHIECPVCKCSCPVCTKCPTCEYTFTDEQVDWMLNYKPRQGASGYQAGGFDCKDDWLQYLEVPGRPRFKSRPSTGYYREAQAETDCTVCFMDGDCDGSFHINNTIWQISGEGVMKWVHKK